MSELQLGTLASAVCAGLLMACSAASTEDDELEPIGRTIDALESNQIVFSSDVTQCDTASQTRAAKTAALFKNDSRTVLLTEGNNCTGTTTEYNNYFDIVWGPGGGIPKSRLKPAPGNHDYMALDSDGNPRGFKNYFGITPTWYTFVKGSWHIFALDSYKGTNTTQLAWLDAELAKVPAEECILAYFHHPRYSSGSKHPTDREKGKALWDRLVAKHADLVLSGHEHNFEVLYADGMTQVVAGTTLNGFASTPDPHSVYRNSSYYGVLDLILDDAGFIAGFRTMDGGGTYTFSGRCSSE
jgi:hypothetical protein